MGTRQKEKNNNLENGFIRTEMRVTFTPMSLTLNYIVSSVYNNENVKKKWKSGGASPLG